VAIFPGDRPELLGPRLASQPALVSVSAIHSLALSLQPRYIILFYRLASSHLLRIWRGRSPWWHSSQGPPWPPRPSLGQPASSLRVPSAPCPVNAAAPCFPYRI